MIVGTLSLQSKRLESFLKIRFQLSNIKTFGYSRDTFDSQVAIDMGTLNHVGSVTAFTKLGKNLLCF